MTIDDLQKMIDGVKADGFKGNGLIRELASRSNLTFEELREQLKQLPDYKRYCYQINNIITQQRKKEKKLSLKTEKAEAETKVERKATAKKSPVTAESDYMEHLTPVWNQIQELNRQEKAIQQKKRNLIATLKQFLEYAESGEEP